ncbi:MAG TPA: Uma2 family endonuclease, partial [Anaerolineae bacterium]|nr:Uma2 family endonuclease [Anaerolineae bacterium]
MTVMIAPPETKLISGEELLVMGDIGPCELIDGRIVPMSPTGGEHGYIEFYLGAELTHFVRLKKS